MKKYIIFSLVFVLAIGAVSASSIFDDALNEVQSLSNLGVDYSESDTNVSVGDYNFTIPQGFGEIKQLAVDVSSKNDTENVKFFTNQNNKIIMISITGSNDINGTIQKYIPEKIPYSNATINGHDGLKWTNESYAFFTYRVNDDLVVIQAPQDSYFEKMII